MPPLARQREVAMFNYCSVISILLFYFIILCKLMIFSKCYLSRYKGLARGSMFASMHGDAHADVRLEEPFLPFFLVY